MIEFASWFYTSGGICLEVAKKIRGVFFHPSFSRFLNMGDPQSSPCLSILQWSNFGWFLLAIFGYINFI